MWPAFRPVDVAEWREAVVLIRRLPELRRLVTALESRVSAALERKAKG